MLKLKVPIGNYRLDILAYESGTDRKIAIENQYGTTNHTHLGQLMTYMAGINAEVVVWIAENFNNEHLTAINHLNQISNEDIAFFCIKPRLIKVGDSDPALEFLVVAKPDEWEKQVKRETKLSDRQIEYEKFWTKLISRFKEIYPNIKPGMWTINRSYMIMCFGGSGLEYTLKFSHGSFLINLYIKGNAKVHSYEIFDKLKAQREFIENELGVELEFDKKEGVKSTRINLYCDANADILNNSEKEKDFFIEWSLKWLPRFKNTIQRIIHEE